MDVVLAIATLLGGVTALWFLIEKWSWLQVSFLSTSREASNLKEMHEKLSSYSYGWETNKSVSYSKAMTEIADILTVGVSTGEVGFELMNLYERLYPKKPIGGIIIPDINYNDKTIMLGRSFHATLIELDLVNKDRDTCKLNNRGRELLSFLKYKH